MSGTIKLPDTIVINGIALSAHYHRDPNDVVLIDWFGICPRTRAALFIVLDNTRYLSEGTAHLPWRPVLWRGYAAGQPAPQPEGQGRRFVTLATARGGLSDQYRAHLS